MLQDILYVNPKVFISPPIKGKLPSDLKSFQKLESIEVRISILSLKDLFIWILTHEFGNLSLSFLNISIFEIIFLGNDLDCLSLFHLLWLKHHLIVVNLQSFTNQFKSLVPREKRSQEDFTIDCSD